MRICSGDVEIRALGAFDEHAYQGGTSRRVLRMRLLDVPTPAQLATLCAGPIALQDDEGSVISTHEGFNAVYECHLALGVYGPEELVYLAEQARADKAERELAATKARADQAEAALAAARAELEVAKTANAYLQAAQPDYHYSKINIDPVTEEGGVS